SKISPPTRVQSARATTTRLAAAHPPRNPHDRSGAAHAQPATAPPLPSRGRSRPWQPSTTAPRTGRPLPCGMTLQTVTWTASPHGAEGDALRDVTDAELTGRVQHLMPEVQARVDQARERHAYLDLFRQPRAAACAGQRTVQPSPPPRPRSSRR